MTLFDGFMYLNLWYQETDIFYMGVRRNGQMKWYIYNFVFYKRDGVLYNNIFCWKDAVNTHTLPRAFYGIDRQLATMCIYWKWGLNVEKF